MREDLEVLLTKELPNTHYAIALKAFFDEELERLNDVLEVKGDVIEKGRIVEGRQHAVRIMKRLMRILNIDKIQNPSKEGSEYK